MIRIARFAALTVLTLVVIAALFFSPSVVSCAFKSADDAPVDDALRLAAATPSQARFTLLKTSHLEALDILTYACGSPFRQAAMNHVAVLVEHPQGNFLFDTGLGRNVDAQVAADMPWWGKLIFTYKKDTPARDQLDAAGVAPPHLILLSHAHWDHASAIADFPEAEVMVPAPEKAFIDTMRFPNVMPSQVGDPRIRWRTLTFEDKPYAGFKQSLDLYADGSVVLVPLYGHTPGSVGLFLTTASGKRFFFVGDTVWRRAALERGSPKFWLLNAIVDDDKGATEAVNRHIQAVTRANPDLTVVPAHDAEAQEPLGFFPRWVN